MKIKNPINIAGGCIVGLLTGKLLIAEGNYISESININWLSNFIEAFSIVFAIIIFLCVLKYFISIKSQKLVVYYLLSILISITAVIFFIYFVFIYLVKWFVVSGLLDYILKNKWGNFIIYNLFLISILILIAIFSCIFYFLTKGKVKYIQHISQEIKKIEKEGFGKTIEIIGNDEISDVCISINYMSQKLLEKEIYEKQMETKKNELITNVSHDLRSPLTSIIGYVELLKKNGTSNPQKFQEYISVVDRRLYGLNYLINELFELTKLNSTDVKLNFEKIDIIPLLKHLLSENEILLRQQGLILERTVTEESFVMNLDINKMVRAIQNLFDNIKKYAKSNSKVIISVIVENQILKIKMTNLIKETDIIEAEKLFERFYKSDLSRNDTESSGLGLAIVKRIVELHLGKITAQLNSNNLTIEILFYNDENILKKK